MADKVKLTFCGGVNTVTGANFLLEADGKKILVDCGLTQSEKLADETNWAPFPYDPKEIDFLFITHAHVDHLGRVPKLVEDGFKGKIISTPPTKDLAKPMLEDTAGILSKSDKYNLDKIYSKENISRAFSLWQTADYRQKISISEKLQAVFLNAGHILGSAMVQFFYNDKKILFTGDLGNSPSPLLPDSDRVEKVDYLVMESVYGDRNHESREDRRLLLEEVIEDNFHRKGVLIIPTFSLERSQEILFEINNLVEEDHIPEMPVFLDSPLAIRLTEIFQKYKSYFNEEAQKIMIEDKSLFKFPGLRFTLNAEESRAIDDAQSPKIIIAGSGMSSGGRVVYHEQKYLPDPNNTLLLIGYQSVGTPGRLIEEGVKTVKIAGEYVQVRAHLAHIYGYSGHKDSDHLLGFIQEMRESLKKVFMVMGEPKSSMFLVQKVRDNLGIEAYAPEQGDSVTLDC